MFGKDTTLNQPEDYMFWVPVAAVFTCNSLLYLFCQLCGKRDNSYIDTMWSLSFIIPNVIVIILRNLSGELELTPRMIAITVPVIIWGLRLSIHIAVRHKSEDYRYKKMREGWEQGGSCVYFLKAYFIVFILQGVLQFVNNASVLYVNLYAPVEDKTLNWLDYIGLTIWLMGFLIEYFADK